LYGKVQKVWFRVEANSRKTASLSSLQIVQMDRRKEKKMNALTTTRYIEQFRNAFTAGIDSIVNASQVYVKAIDEDPEIKERFKKEFSDMIPASAWSGFEAVGRKWLHPKLLMGGGGRYATMIKRLPYSDQEQIFEGKRYDLLTIDGDKLLVDVRQVTPEQAEQLFDRSHIRSVSEQKAWLESRKRTPEKTEVQTMPYSITSGKVYFRRGVELTRSELKRILQDM